MKPQDFMEALGGVSQEKLDALAKWQEAKTPVTGYVPAKKDRFTQAAAEPVSAARRRGTMKQHTQKHPAVTRLFPWNIGIGAAALAALVVAVSIGKEAIGQRNQMQVGMSGETSAAEQVSKQETNAEKTNHEPVPLIENIYASIGTNETAPEISGNGLVEVWRSMDDAAEFIEYDQIGKLLDCSKHFTEALFAEYDVLYIAFPYDEKLMPITTFRYQLSGGEFDADGKIHLTTGALVLDELPNGWAIDQPRFHSTNEYWFYTVPKDSLPDIQAWEIETDEYHIGELDETAKDAANGDDAINQFIKTTDAYQKWDAAVNGELYITWADSTPILPEDCVEANSADTVQNPQYIAMMQEYYTQKSGIPCDFDFSGMGRDLDEIIETDDARFHIKGMAGCDWTMFVFFDVEPLNLSAEDTAYLSSMAFPNLSDNLCLNFGILDAEGKAVDFFQRTTRTMPGQQSLDNGIFHCYCLISSHSAEAFTDGGKYLGIGKMNEPNEPEYDIRIPLDCLQTIPMQESELAETVSAFIPDESAHCYTPKPMKRCAVTPFGVYCVSDPFDSEHKTGWAQSCYWLENPEYKLKATPVITQNSADGVVLSEIGLDGLTGWGSSIKEGTGVSFADFLFDRPYDVSKGTLTMLQPE